MWGIEVKFFIGYYKKHYDCYIVSANLSFYSYIYLIKYQLLYTNLMKSIYAPYFV